MNNRRTLSSSLSSQIVEYLRGRGHAQAELARMLGVSEGFISLVKSRDRSLTIDHLERLAEALSVPLGALLVAATAPMGQSRETKELSDLSTRIIEKADAARRAILRGMPAPST
ncbi:MAG TPA: helix-turn-helix transcriptional regulator [Tepidisphaeraceae bacterium]|jgi:transcriptional regulator with XRE-family HTH domain